MKRRPGDKATILVNWQAETRTVRYYSEDGSLDYSYALEGEYPHSVYDESFPHHVVEPLADALGEWLSTKHGLLFLTAKLDMASSPFDDNTSFTAPDEFTYLLLAAAYYACGEEVPLASLDFLWFDRPN